MATWSIAALAALAILIRPWKLAEAVWAVAAASVLVAMGNIALVAGLFVLVEALQRTGALRALSAVVDGYAHGAARATSWWAGVAVAVAAMG
jgi:Na+/H+ antiporter NhaD/arsenite permease-like protein